MPNSIELSISGREKFIFEVLFPILEPGENLLGNCIRIVDFRTKPDQFAFLSDMQKKGATPNDIRLLWKGLRFLCRTLREWEKPGITWPEDMEGDV